MDRAFSSLTVRTVNEDQRIIEGIASTPRPDRVGDIVESLGAEYSLPIPFMLDHNHTEAVGEVELAEVTAKGIRFRARIFKIAEPGAAKDLVDRAWSLIKSGLRKFVSIGFRPIDYEMMASGGTRFRSWEWLELSAVSVPAQPDARIDSVKANLARDSRVKLDPFTMHALNGTLKINCSPRNKAGEFQVRKIIRTTPRQVRLTSDKAPWLVRSGPTVVVKLNDADRRRAKTRVVKL